MLIVGPGEVRFGGRVWERVSWVSVAQEGEGVVAEWGDEGPHAAFVDVPRRRVDIEVVQEVAGTDLVDPELGEREDLVVLARSAGGATRTVRVDAVVRSVRHEVSARGATRRVRLIGVSDDGSDDPVAVTGG
ncbi:MAG: hypothetical protein AAF356_11330 [Planctomycetota bacterium]